MHSGNNELTLKLQMGGKFRRKALGHIATTLSQHPTLASAAKTLGVHERTLHRWLVRYPSLSRARQEGAQDSAMQTMRDTGMHVMVAVVNDDE